MTDNGSFDTIFVSKCRTMNELRLIGLAIALSEHGHFRRAADALNLSQPSLSRGIAELERSLGVSLFDRTTKGVVPTAFGRVLIDRGQAVLRDAARLRQEIDLLAGLETGALSVAAAPFPGESTVAVALGQLALRYPRLRMKLIVADPDKVIAHVLSGEIDIGVASVFGYENDRHLTIEAVLPVPVFLACRSGHLLTQEIAPTLKQVFSYPFAGPPLRGVHAEVAAAAASPVDRAPLQGSGIAESVAAIDARGATFTPQISVSSMQAARLIALNSDAVFAAPASFLADDVAAARLVRLNVDVPEMKTSHGISRTADRSLSPAERVFIDLLRQVEAKAHQSGAAPFS
jgi:DNA-binding transcriptional LysR family regulator